MWQKACKRFSYSVQAILLKTAREGGKGFIWQNIGTSFAIKRKPNPLFITNAHVICSNNGEPYNNKNLAFVAHHSSEKPIICGIDIKFIDKTLDIAVFEASKEGEDISPVIFAEPTVLQIGASVASIGFPIPENPKLTPTGGQLSTNRRLATGFISSNECLSNFGILTKELKHYEINMFSYPGLSGAPVFNIDGFVVGINCGNLSYIEQVGSSLYSQHVTAYAYAIRGHEIIMCMEKNGIEIEVNPNS
jgi:S1-C subfamily serine protease